MRKKFGVNWKWVGWLIVVLLIAWEVWIGYKGNRWMTINQAISWGIGKGWWRWMGLLVILGLGLKYKFKSWAWLVVVGGGVLNIIEAWWLGGVVDWIGWGGINFNIGDVMIVGGSLYMIREVINGG